MTAIKEHQNDLKIDDENTNLDLMIGDLDTGSMFTKISNQTDMTKETAMNKKK